MEPKPRNERGNPTIKFMEPSIQGWSGTGKGCKDQRWRVTLGGSACITTLGEGISVFTNTRKVKVVAEKAVSLCNAHVAC